MVKIAILDFYIHAPGLKILFPEAQYFGWKPDATYNSGPDHTYKTPEKFRELYNFDYEYDWDLVKNSSFNLVLIVENSHCCSNMVDSNPWYRSAQFIAKHIRHIPLENRILFDNSDYDLNPVALSRVVHACTYFKRNYNKKKTYPANVYPFPYIIFGTPCCLWLLLTHRNNYKTIAKNQSITKVFWGGSLYKHDFPPDHVRDRRGMYDQICDYLEPQVVCHFFQFYERMAQAKISVDILGVGEPNRKALEIFACNSLRIYNKETVAYPFENEDCFDDQQLSFETREEFKRIYNEYALNSEKAEKALAHQNYLVDKYMNEEYLRTYILKNHKYKQIQTPRSFAFLVPTFLGTDAHWLIFKMGIQCLLNLHPDIPILVIDGGSTFATISETEAQLHTLFPGASISVYSSPAPGSGEFGAYYFYYLNPWFEKVCVIQDSYSIKKSIDFKSVDRIAFVRWIKVKTWENFMEPPSEYNTLHKIKNHDDLLIDVLNEAYKDLPNYAHFIMYFLETFYSQKWTVCGGVMSVISQEALSDMVEKTNVFHLLPFITSKRYRMAMETLWAFYCGYVKPDLINCETALHGHWFINQTQDISCIQGCKAVEDPVAIKYLPYR